MAEWMGRLPDAVKKKPLCNLCIPGSHDSGAHWFNMRLGYAHDQSFLRYIRSFKCAFIKRIVKRWGLTQSLSIEEQLRAGVRFFDLRLELGLDTRFNSQQVVAEDPNDESSKKSCFIVHGLYSTDWLKLAAQMIKFLEDHPEELVILNASHTYFMGPVDFKRFFLHPLAKLAAQSGISLCDTSVDLRTISLEELIQRNYRIVVAGPTDQDVDGICFRSAAIQNKWPNKNSTAEIIKFCQGEIHAPVTPGLRVLQGVVTPKLSDIFRNLRGSLRNVFSMPMRSLLKLWVRRLNTEESGNLNILIADQIDNEFCRLVYYLNVRHDPEYRLDQYFGNPHLDEVKNVPLGLISDSISWLSPTLEMDEMKPSTTSKQDKDFCESIEEEKKEEEPLVERFNGKPVAAQAGISEHVRALEDELHDSEPEILIEEIFDEFDTSYPPMKPARTSVMVQQIEMVLDDTSSDSTTTPARSPNPPPKPKRFSCRIPIVMEVVPIPDNAIPTDYNDRPFAPFSRSIDTPVRIALPVTEEELRLAALGEYPSYASSRSYRYSERREVSAPKEVKIVEKDEAAQSGDESSPLISHEVENMVEDLVINCTIDAMDNLASQFKSL